MSDVDPSLEEVTREVEQGAERRLASATFSSDLTATQYGACLELDMVPVGFVQGFCAMRFSSYSTGYWSYLGSGSGGFYRQWTCPHGYVSMEHRGYGYNAEMTLNESAWTQGYSSAFTRMMGEAREAGAHGVIGVAHSFKSLVDTSVREFHLTGTAVKVRGADAPREPFSTFLAGQRLVKLVEAGYMPVSVVASLAEIGVYANCVTEALVEGRYFAGSGMAMGGLGGLGMGGLGAGRMGGLGGLGMGGLGAGRMGGFGGGFAGGGGFGGVMGGARGSGGWSGSGVSSGAGGRLRPQEIDQITEAYTSAYQIANERVAQQLGGDTLHGARVSTSSYEMGEGNRVVTCFAEGTRVRRFADPEPIPQPKAVVGLWD